MRTFRALYDEDGAVWLHNMEGAYVLRPVPRFPVRGAEEIVGGCTAPMPGQVVQVAVTSGQEVQKGDLLIILEAMKMEHSVKAPADGVIARVAVKEGDQVDVDALLVVLEEAGDANPDNS